MSELRPPTTFLFDLGNVLVHFSTDVWNRQLAEVGGVSIDAIARLRADPAIASYERGEITTDELHRWFERSVGNTVDPDAFAIAYSNIFNLNSPMIPVLDALRARGHRLVLLSNTSALHIDWVGARFDVLERFDALVLSHRAGVMKPDPAIFAAAIAVLGCPPDACLYTDDIVRYVDAAKTHGLRATVFTTTERYVADLADHGIVLAR